MEDKGSTDPLSTHLDNLRHALTDQRFRAATQTGELAIEVTADGAITSWHLDDTLRATDPRKILDTFVKLHAKATQEAHTTLTDANTAVINDPRVHTTINQLVAAYDQPHPTGDTTTQQTGQSPDRSVTIEVDTNGIIPKVHLDEYAQTLHPRDVAEAIMRAQRAAHGAT